MKRFNVVLSRDDGGVEVHPMKEWLRQHPQQIPGGLDPSHSTSHQLRNGLKRLGWTVQETATEERLFPPGGAVQAASVEAVLGEDVETVGDEDIGPDAAFGLEAQLRDFLAQNINKIDVGGKRLRLFVDPTGRDGIEFSTAVGPIDILAVDDGGAFYVFELKRGRSPDHAMGQLTRYMGWVRQTIGKNRSVNGIIVAKEISQSLRYAVSVVPNVGLFEYEVEFHLHPAHEIK
jgi:hypothetical protein